jgi:serine/threonine-protein kinase
MVTDSLIDFFEALCRYRLLVPEQLDEVTRTLWPRSPDSRALAKELIQRDWLTPYQVNQLFQGRGDGLVLGQYVLLERLGEGGMGQVFKARHHGLGRVVALKLIRKDRLTSPGAVRRFHHEIQAAARLGHPNVVQAYDAGEVNGQHFYIMEYVPGTDLAKLVRKSGALPVPQACDYVRQAALGLQHAHEQGMIHRDIKPGNLLLTTRPGTAGRPPEEIVKVLDMGLALISRPDGDGHAGSSSSSSGSELTREGVVVGTADYMAPEQALSSHDVDIRADLYALGCTLYYLLAGRVPFPGRNAAERLLKHHLEAPPPPEQFRPGLCPAVAAVVNRLMAKKPADRYQTPAEVADALGEALRGGAADVPLVSVPAVPGPTSATEAAAPTSLDTFLSPFADLAGGTTEMNPARRPPRAPGEEPPWVGALVVGSVLAGLLLLLILLLL